MDTSYNSVYKLKHLLNQSEWVAQYFSEHVTFKTRRKSSKQCPVTIELKAIEKCL